MTFHYAYGSVGLIAAAPIAASNAVGEIGVTLVGRAGGGRGVNLGASPGAIGDVGTAANQTQRVWGYTFVDNTGHLTVKHTRQNTPPGKRHELPSNISKIRRSSTCHCKSEYIPAIVSTTGPNGRDVI